MKTSYLVAGKLEAHEGFLTCVHANGFGMSDKTLPQQQQELENKLKELEIIIKKPKETEPKDIHDDPSKNP